MPGGRGEGGEAPGAEAPGGSAGGAAEGGRGGGDGEGGGQTDRDESVEHALGNYERFHELPAGTATIDQLQASCAGIDGWAGVGGGASGAEAPGGSAGGAGAGGRGGGDGEGGGENDRDERIEHALGNYERFHELPAGTATIDQLQASCAGVDGWAGVGGGGGGEEREAPEREALGNGDETALSALSPFASASLASSPFPPPPPPPPPPPASGPPFARLAAKRLAGNDPEPGSPQKRSRGAFAVGGPAGIYLSGGSMPVVSHGSIDGDGSSSGVGSSDAEGRGGEGAGGAGGEGGEGGEGGAGGAGGAGGTGRGSSGGGGEGGGQTARDNRVENALRNYERFHELPAGTATIDQLQASCAGIDGWAGVGGRGAVYQRLHRMQTQLATLERENAEIRFRLRFLANRNLLAKLHASKPMSVTFQTHVPPSAPAAGPQRPSTSAGEQGARADGDDVVITRVTRVDDPVASIDLRDEDSEDVEAEDSSGRSRSAGSAGGSGG